MSRFEINGLYTLPNGIHIPCGLNFKDKLWWRFVPGVVINVKWPVGKVIVSNGMQGWDWTLGATLQEIESADPNDHYRPWMEANVGQQGWDWNWGMANRDASDNRLTIKIRKKHHEYAIIAKLMWS